MKRNIIIAAALVAITLFGAGRGLAQNTGTAPTPPSMPIVTAAPAPAAATTQNTITTTAPVKSETTISVGTLAGEVLTWIAAAFSLPIGGLITKILFDFLKKIGLQTSEVLRQEITNKLVNGMNLAARDVAARAEGKGQVEIHNEIVAKAVEYAQAHGADAIKKLGLDPESGEAVQALRARLETAIADPQVPTPAVMQPPVIPAATIKPAAV